MASIRHVLGMLSPASSSRERACSIVLETNLSRWRYSTGRFGLARLVSNLLLLHPPSRSFSVNARSAGTVVQGIRFENLDLVSNATYRLIGAAQITVRSAIGTRHPCSFRTKRLDTAPNSQNLCPVPQ